MSRFISLGIAVLLTGCILPQAEDLPENSTDGSILVTTDAGTRAPDAQLAPDAQVWLDAAPDAAPLPCTGGEAQSSDPISGRCYMLFSTPTAWDAAKTACAALGAKTHLVTITSIAEQDRAYALAGARDTWIGRSDSVQESTWIWVTNEAPALSNWADAEPNGGINENCAIVRPPTGQWDDRPCTATYAYLCERDP